MSDVQNQQPFQPAPAGQPQPQQPAKKKPNVMLMGIFGIVATLLGTFVPFVGWVGLVLGISAIVESNKLKKADPNDSQAKTAFILGIVAVVLFVAIFAGSFLLVGVLMSNGQL